MNALRVLMAGHAFWEVMSYKYTLVEKVDGVGILTLNRSKVLNAMNHGLSSELHDAVETSNSDDETDCIVITGSVRRAFSAGGDIHEQRVHAMGLTDEGR